MGVQDLRRTGRRFRAPHPGDEVDLWLCLGLLSELASPTAVARVRELRASGVDRLRVRVVKVPWGDVLAAEDAVKVEAPEFVEDTGDPTLYVSLKFLDLPTI
jgi:hypothetical protein